RSSTTASLLHRSNRGHEHRPSEWCRRSSVSGIQSDMVAVTPVLDATSVLLALRHLDARLCKMSRLLSLPRPRRRTCPASRRPRSVSLLFHPSARCPNATLPQQDGTGRPRLFALSRPLKLPGIAYFCRLAP